MICVRVLGTVAGEINRFVLDLFSNWEVSEKKKRDQMFTCLASEILAVARLTYGRVV